MRVSGRLGILSEAAAGIGVPFSVLYESVPRVAIPLSALGTSRAEGPAEQTLSVDIYSLIEEVRRSIFELKARTASVPEIYTYYIPQAALVPVPVSQAAPVPMPVPPAMSGPISPPVESHPTVYITERAVPDDKKPEGIEPAGIAPARSVHAVDNDIIRSNLALGRLREDYAGLTRDLTEIERLIDEAKLSSSADIPAIVGMKAVPVIPETVVAEKTVIVKEESEKGILRDSEVSRPYPVVARPPKLASVLAQSISLPEVIRKSTVEMLVMQTVFAAEVPAPAMVGPVQAAPVPETFPPMVAPAAERSIPAPGLMPDKITTKPTTMPTPVTRALDIARAFNALIGSYLAFRGTPARRRDIKEGVTQLLLSLPEQQSVEGPVSGLFDVMAALQVSGPKMIEEMRPIEVAAKTPAAAAPVPKDDEPMRSTILGDLSEMQGTMTALRDAVGGLQRASLSSKDVSGAAGATAAVWPEDDGMAGELSIIHASITGLQTAMEYLRFNVPTLADFVVLQKAIVSIPRGPPSAAPEAATPVAIAIEGMQPKSAPISLPDLSWVTREFGLMQGMIARLQVPMYAEGGLVQQPTLAFVGESEPEWIVPMSAWDDSQAKLNDFYHMLWSQIQNLGVAMQDTVSGVNEALADVTSGGTVSVVNQAGEGATSGGNESDNVDLGQYIQDTMKGLVDKYLGMIGLSVDSLMNAQKTAGMGLVLGAATVALPYAKNIMLGEDEEEKDEASDGGKEDAEEEDDEEDFWELIDGLEDAGSISDKRDGKFDPDEE